MSGSSELLQLFLHPRLPTEAARYLEERAAAAGARHACVAPPSGSDDSAVMARLREQAMRTTRSLVVLPDRKDAAFFEDAQVDTSMLKQEPRGWVLEAAPDLVAPPESPPPALWTVDGRPLFPHPALAEKLRKERRDGRRRTPDPARWERSDAIGQEPTFSVAEIGEHGMFSPGIYPRQPSAEAVFAAMTGKPVEPWNGSRGPTDGTFVWEWQKRVFSFGSPVDLIRVGLGGESCPHPVDEPSTFAEWRQAIQDWNPWATLPKPHDVWRPETADLTRWSSLVERVHAECGVGVTACAKAWWDHATTLSKVERVHASPQAGGDTRRALEDLATRDVEVDVSAASVVFRLQAAAAAPLLELPRSGRDLFHVIANLGAGHLLRIRCLSFPAEERTPLRGGLWVLTGGDVTVLMSADEDLLLEAGSHAAVRRRERERVAAEAAASDDD